MIEESRKYQFISTDLRAGIFTVRLARPAVNVIHAPMMLEIADALDVAENDPGSFVVVITGSGSRAFSAGAEIGDHDREHIEELMENMKGFLTRLQTFPLPTIAALSASEEDECRSACLRANSTSPTTRSLSGPVSR